MQPTASASALITWPPLIHVRFGLVYWTHAHLKSALQLRLHREYATTTTISMLTFRERNCKAFVGLCHELCDLTMFIHSDALSKKSKSSSGEQRFQFNSSNLPQTLRPHGKFLLLLLTWCAQ